MRPRLRNAADAIRAEADNNFPAMKMETFGTKLPSGVWANLQCRLLWAYRGRVPQAFQTCWVDHAGHFLVWLIEQGEIRVDDGEREAVGKPGDWLVVPRGKVRQAAHPKTRLISINVVCQWPGGRDLFNGAWAEVFSADEHPRLRRMALDLVKAAETCHPDNSAALEYRPLSLHPWLTLQSLAMRWFGGLSEVLLAKGWTFADAAKDERALRIRRIVQIPPLSDAALHERIRVETGLSPASAARVFRKEYGMALGDCWNGCRAHHVKGLLAHGAPQMKELSAQLGFSRQSHFTRWFKKQVGTCPKDYQKKWRSSTRTTTEGFPRKGNSAG